MEFTSTLLYGAFTAVGILMAIALLVLLWRLVCHIDIIDFFELVLITGLMAAFLQYLQCRVDPADAEKLMALLRMPSVLELKCGMFISALLLLPVSVSRCWKKATETQEQCWKILLLAIPLSMVFFAIFVNDVLFNTYRLRMDADTDWAPKVHEAKNRLELNFDDVLQPSDFAVSTPDGETVPYIQKGDRILVNDMKFQKQGIVVTWKDELYGNMRGTYLRDDYRILTWRDLFIFIVLLGLTLSILRATYYCFDERKSETEPIADAS